MIPPTLFFQLTLLVWAGANAETPATRERAATSFMVTVLEVSWNAKSGLVEASPREG
jgi:hypothetical protein